MADFGLRTYQQEVVERALHGENVIIWLPTGGGKTRAAVYVAKHHLETTEKAKVVVLVNKVHLVDQHYKNEFNPRLGRDYTLVPVSGDTEYKDFFGGVVQNTDVIICTAQILYNAMISTEESKHVELSDITLLIIDECHHTHKESVYNKIMSCYVEKKLEGEGPLPQILGLTASPGTGKAKSMDGAVKHVLQICANLDSAIVSTELYTPDLQETVPRPFKTFDIVDPRPEDPFGDRLKRIMEEIHEYMELPLDFTLRPSGTQDYEADVVILEQRGVREHNRRLKECALHLRKYNDALLINDTLRMMDAYRSLEGFYVTKSLTAIDDTDGFLMKLFEANEASLRALAEDLRYENPKMAKLEDVLLKQFGADEEECAEESKGILFCKTRVSSHCLNDWIRNNTALKEAGVKAAILIGAGIGPTRMTQQEQSGTILKFRDGVLNLLISTSVLEEGVDVPQCNLVVRYGLLTNEISQQQARGRARAANSRYSVVATEGGREHRKELSNEDLEELTVKAIARVQDMSDEEFRTKLTELQKEAVRRRTLAESGRAAKRLYAASSVTLYCRNCFKTVVSGDDIKLLDNSSYVNVDPGFAKHYKRGAKLVLPKKFEDWEPGCTIRCNNGNCNNKWGHEIKYKEAALLATLSISDFGLETPDGRLTVRRWKDVPFTVEDFCYTRYCEENFADLTDFSHLSDFSG